MEKVDEVVSLISKIVDQQQILMKNFRDKEELEQQQGVLGLISVKEKVVNLKMS